MRKYVTGKRRDGYDLIAGTWFDKVHSSMQAVACTVIKNIGSNTEIVIGVGKVYEATAIHFPKRRYPSTCMVVTAIFKP